MTRTAPIETRITTLPNGFRIVTETMPGLATAALGIWIEAGCRHEGAAETGIAHFLEHMAFKGTARRTAFDIAEEIEGVGGYLNAYTARDRTAFYARVMAEDVALALDILADILRSPRLAEEDIEVERGVILQEIGQSHDTPDDVIFDWLQETAFPDQPMGRPILGPPELVRGFGREAFSAFIGRHYAPERMVLAAAGAVDHEMLVRLATGLFGDLPRGGAATPEPARWQGGERRAVKKLEQAHLALGLPSPGDTDPGLQAALVWATALGGGSSSRLFQEAREKRGLCYSIHAGTSAWADSGLLTVYAGTGAGQIADLVRLVAEQIADTAASLTEAETARARAQVRAGLLMGLESPLARAERMAVLLSIWGRVPGVEESLERIDAVTADRARSAAARIAVEPPALALYGPVRKAPGAEALARLLAA